jgi:hypothetical protein
VADEKNLRGAFGRRRADRLVIVVEIRHGGAAFFSKMSADLRGDFG